MHTNNRTLAPALLLIVALLIAACGGGSNGNDATTDAASTSEAAADTTASDDATSSTSDSAASDSAASDSAASDSAASDSAASDTETGAASDGAATEADAGTDGSDTSAIAEAAEDSVVDTLLAAMPDRCRDGLVEALQMMEPIVSDTDWSTATLGEFETTTERLDELPEPFADAPECEDVAFEEALGMGVLNRIAADEAPGTLGFLDATLTMFEAPGLAALDEPDCDGAFEALESMATTYATMSDVPMTQFAELAPLMMSAQFCPDFAAQLAAAPEIEAFLDS